MTLEEFAKRQDAFLQTIPHISIDDPGVAEAITEAQKRLIAKLYNETEIYSRRPESLLP